MARYLSRLRHPLTLSLVAVGILSAGLAGGVLLVSAFDNDEQGGQTSAPVVPQHAIASDAGITLMVVAAEFSGTASFLEVDVALDGTLGEVQRVRIPTAALAPGGLRPIEAQAGIVIPVGEPAILRLAPLTPGEQPRLETSAVDLLRPDMTWKRITGSWTLQLDLGGPAAEVLRLDQMTPGAAIADAGVEVRPVSAVISTTETLVTLEIDGPPGINDLMLPTIVGSSPPVHGARVTWDGTLATFTFPPVDPGQSLIVDLGELIVSGAPVDAGYVDIDIDGAMTRQGAKGEFAEWLLLDPGDLSIAEGAEFQPYQAQFVKTSVDIDGSNAINISVTGSYDDPANSTLTLADGTVLRIRGSGTDYPLDPSSNITTGSTYLTFVFEDLDKLRQGPVRLAVGSSPSTVLRGNWSVTFNPAP
jgi:hypothetical protein